MSDYQDELDARNKKRADILKSYMSLNDYFPSWKLKINLENEEIIFSCGKLNFRLSINRDNHASVSGLYPRDMAGNSINVYGGEKNKFINSPSLKFFPDNFSLEEVALKIKSKFLLQYMEHFILVDAKRKETDKNLEEQKSLNLAVAKLFNSEIDDSKLYESHDIFFGYENAHGKVKASTYSDGTFELNMYPESMVILEKIVKAIK